MPDVLFIETKFKSSRRTEFTQSRGEWSRCLWSKDILKETVLCVVCVGRLNKKYMIVFADPFQSFTRTFDLMGNCSEERSGGGERQSWPPQISGESIASLFIVYIYRSQLCTRMRAIFTNALLLQNFLLFDG